MTDKPDAPFDAARVAAERIVVRLRFAWEMRQNNLCTVSGDLLADALAEIERFRAAPAGREGWREAAQAVVDCCYVGGNDPARKLTSLTEYIHDLARVLGDKRAPTQEDDRG